MIYLSPSLDQALLPNVMSGKWKVFRKARKITYIGLDGSHIGIMSYATLDIVWSGECAIIQSRIVYRAIVY